MPCGGCGKKARNGSEIKHKDSLAGGVSIKSLNQRQINARLEVFKRRFCSDCKDRYECNYEMFLNCKGNK